MGLMAKTILPVILTFAFALGLLFVPKYLAKSGFIVSNNHYVSRQFNYQILLLVVTSVSMLATYLQNKHNFKTYFSFGHFNAVGQELKLFGIQQGDTWIKTGLSLCFVVSLVTGTFLYFYLKQTNVNWSSLQTGFFWIVLFSLTNSFGEEMIFRLGIVSSLSGHLSPTTIFLISGILFGIPHFAGMPNGITGVILAGVLGFVLAKSMYETNGFFWPWTIHFLQDVLIFGTLFLTNENTITSKV